MDRGNDNNEVKKMKPRHAFQLNISFEAGLKKGTLTLTVLFLGQMVAEPEAPNTVLFLSLSLEQTADLFILTDHAA